MTLEAHYALDEDSGSTAYDYSGNEHHATNRNGAGPSGTGTTTGPFGNSAYLFDGSDDETSTGASVPSPLADGYYATSAWVRFDNINGTRQYITTFSIDSNNHHNIALWDDNNIYTFLQQGGSNDRRDTGFAPNQGEWYHIVANITPSENICFINGVEEERGTHALTPSNMTSDGVAGVGNRIHGSDAQLEGGVADARIYDRILSPQEVQALYQAGVQSEVTFR